MECLRNFSLTVSGNENASGAKIDTWGLAPQNYWLYKSSGHPSIFTVQGFKNINIFGIEAVGNVSATLASTYSALVQDWAFTLEINGTYSEIGGIISTTNPFILQKQSVFPYFDLSKYTPKFNFVEPIQSVSSIKITNLKAQGIGYQNGGVINIGWEMAFIIYYRYEGEEFALL